MLRAPLLLFVVAASSISLPAQTLANASPTATGNFTTKPAWHESWTDLSLANSGLDTSLFNAVLLSKVEEPAFTRELIRMEWRQNDPIEVTIVIPHTSTKPPVILYLYDYTGDTDRFRNDGWCARMTQKGFAAVGFVSALSGQRVHQPRPMKEWFVSELQETLATSAHDVQMVLNYLAKRPDLDTRRVGMFGQGSGASIAILAASVDSRITALDLLNPWGDWPDWLKSSPRIPEAERPRYLTPSFLSRVQPLDPINTLPLLSEKRIRIQQVLDDEVTPAAARDKIASAIPKSARLVRYPDSTAHAKAWHADGLSGWLQQQMHSTSSVQHSTS